MITHQVCFTFIQSVIMLTTFKKDYAFLYLKSVQIMQNMWMKMGIYNRLKLMNYICCLFTRQLGLNVLVQY